MNPSLEDARPVRATRPPNGVAQKVATAAPWIAGWLRDRAFKATLRVPAGERHLLFAICDHFEPFHGHASRAAALGRVREWRERYPLLVDRFRDATGRSPRHSFFFPGEEYDPAIVESLGEFVERGLGEVEVHLHHDRDTRATLREKLEATLSVLSSHGVLSARGGRRAWSFIHGNWALSNGRPDGRWCGVDDELTLLRELGCYADFTFPSAPDPCQPRIVNAIYYARDETERRAYDRPEAIAVGSPRRDRVLLVQGPLAIARRESARASLRIESAALQAGDPPTRARLRTWLEQWVHVAGRPEWIFVKLHAHGAPEKNAQVMLGEPMAELHRALGALRGSYVLHYVTAREMYNVARAAMDGHCGSPAAFFDYEIPPAERARARPT